MLEALAVLGMLVAVGLLTLGGRIAAEGEAPGELTLGVVGIEMPRELGVLSSDEIRGSSIELAKISGAVSVRAPEDVSGYVDAIRVPGLATIFFVGGGVVVVCELLRRVFRQVGRGEAFVRANVRRVSLVGAWVIVLTVGTSALGSWTQYRAATYMKQHVVSAGLKIDFVPPVPQHGVSLERGLLVFHLNPAGLLAGLVILALAEAFRQGLTLKEENDLTV